MKFLQVPSGLAVLIILIGTACSKQIPVNEEHRPGINRKVRFILHTDNDFAGDHHTIIFTPFIKNLTNHVLWDSVLTPMQVKDIPDSEHRLIIEKSVPGDDASLLKVGFYYTINNVGESWYLDSFKVGDTLKIIDFNFR